MGILIRWALVIVVVIALVAIAVGMPHAVAKSASDLIATVTGNGSSVYSGEAVPATSVGLRTPAGLAVGPDGCLYIAEEQANRVRKVAVTGSITTIAGTGQLGYSGDGGPAVKAMLHWPRGVAVASDGSIYIADSGNHRIRRVGPRGIITTVAGDGWTGNDGDGRYSGDAGPAVRASLNWPSDVAMGSDGSVYIADFANYRIRRLSLSGAISTVAGDGWQNERRFGRYSGDGGPASRASLFMPMGVAVSPGGEIYIADLANRRIRKVNREGIITTVAGNGERGYSGDSGPATDAALQGSGVAVGRLGGIYVADSVNNRVRAVGADGIITTVAGNGEPGHSGDGGPATEASVGSPTRVALAPDGSLYIAHGDGWVRKVSMKR